MTAMNQVPTYILYFKNILNNDLEDNILNKLFYAIITIIINTFIILKTLSKYSRFTRYCNVFFIKKTYYFTQLQCQ